MLRFVLVCCLILAASACASDAKPQQEGASGVVQPEGDLVACAGDILTGKPVSHGNLVVFPLYLRNAAEIKEDYATLEEALSKQQVQVSEKDEGGEVNCVEVQNTSGRPIYILAGQVIVGGKQDRVITKDTIIPPGGKMQVEVCCVEHGRWSPHSGESGIAFAGYEYMNAQSGIKRLAQAKGQHAQGEVWKEVAKTVDKLQAETSSGTYKEVIEKTSDRVEDFLKALKALENDSRICGFVSCINGKVQACDLFASPKLLAKFRDSLLRSYALDALYAGEKKDAPEAGLDAVKSFLAEMLKAQDKSEKIAEDSHRRLEKSETEKVILFRNKLVGAQACEEALHYNAYSK
jgi:hypothetical protein